MIRLIKKVFKLNHHAFVLLAKSQSQSRSLQLETFAESTYLSIPQQWHLSRTMQNLVRINIIGVLF